MKKLIVIFLVMLSCSSEDNNDNLNQEELIIGEWTISRFQRETNGVIVKDNFASECQLEFGRLIFNKNNTYIFSNGGGNTLDDCSSGSQEGIYSIGNGKIIFSGLSGDRLIDELSSKTLKFRHSVCDYDCNDWNITYYVR